MIFWKKNRLFQFIYVIIPLVISLIFVNGEEIQNVSESSQPNTSKQQEKFQSEGEALVESGLKFPTLQSFFLWLQSFDQLRSEYSNYFESIASTIPPKDEFEQHVIVMKSYSSIIQCLEMIKDLTVIYESSISGTDSEMISEGSHLSIDVLINECLIPSKELLLSSYIRLQELTFESGKVFTPSILKSSEIVMELYYKIWEILSSILGYVKMIQHMQNMYLRDRSQTQEKITYLESKQENTALEALELNIYKRKSSDYIRLETLIALLLSLLEGDFTNSIQISELESLILVENKRSISELEDSIKSLENSLKGNEQETGSNLKLLISALKNEISLRSDELMRQVSGSSIYVQKFDPELGSIFERLSTSVPDSGKENKADDSNETGSD